MKKGGTFHWITHRGETKTMAEWARITGIKRETLRDRLEYGWSIERTLDTPLIVHKGGTRKSKEYKSWLHMKYRCFNLNYPSYHRYGGRGITVYEGWVNDFDAFLAHIGPAPGKGRFWSVDRINNNGHYEPGNVRWATPKQQVANRERRRKVSEAISD